MTSIKTPDDQVRGYVAPTFRNTHAIITMHNRARFGHTNDLSALIQGTSDDQRDYVVGAFSISICILAVLLVWTITLVVLKCMGKRVGCAAGYPPKLTHSTAKPVMTGGNDTNSSLPRDGIDSENITEGFGQVEEDENNNGGDLYESSVEVGIGSEKVMQVEGKNEDCQLYGQEVRRVKRLVMWTRVIFLVAASAVLAGTILLIVEGFGSFAGSFSAAFASIDQIERVSMQGINATNEYLSSTSMTEQYYGQLKTDLEGTCVNTTFLPTEEMKTLSSSLSNFTLQTVVPEVQGIQHDLYEILNITSSLTNNLKNMKWALHVALAAAFVLIFMTIIFIIGVILAWWGDSSKPFRCVQTYTVLPIFISFMLISAVFSAVFIIGALVGSDFCFDSPDGSVVAVLEENKHLFSSIVYELILYYVQGCQDSLPALQLSSYIQEGAQALAAIQNVTQSLSGILSEQWIIACGDNQSTIVNIATLVEMEVKKYLQALIDIRVILSCASFNPIYVDLVYKAACYSGIDAFARMFRSQLAIAIAGMTMVTLRVSWQQVEDEDNEGATLGNNGANCTRCCRK